MAPRDPFVLSKNATDAEAFAETATVIVVASVAVALLPVQLPEEPEALPVTLPVSGP